MKLDRETVAVLRAHRERQAAERAARLEKRLPWARTPGRSSRRKTVVAAPGDGQCAFPEIVAHADLPPISLTSDTFIELFQEYEEALMERAAAPRPEAGLWHNRSHRSLMVKGRPGPLTCLLVEPPVVFEPTTYALQGAAPCLHALKPRETRGIRHRFLTSLRA
ncbi:hypothetical protein PV963_20690 [Streptomyces coeruleorubidus]|uniref:hypothetical protein n=1 Tax=Streptomyces coeruleorubidus TaxID=116188 RepID=UPI00237F1B3C|nr:hypothetical protein [Streptomyces coeruleorubidus]WDV52621.1 hypothetical protein PV963_20690 [Streptomyces coeruleorubidus]